MEGIAAALKYRELNFKHMNSPTEFANPHVLKEEFVPMRFCGVGPGKMKLWQISQSRSKSFIPHGKTMQRKGKKPRPKVGSAVHQQGCLLEILSEGPLKCSLKVYGSPELLQGINISHPYSKSSQHRGCTGFAQFRQEKSGCNVQEVKRSPSTFRGHSRTLNFSFSFLPNSDDKVSNLSVSLLTKISKTREVSSQRKIT